ncbi:MAG TPA: 5'-nucleotidase C-terminal domain-containing protein [Gemmatimonadaceae bacterium]|nr:5'-nucleotidase C-terminal domain-containing protein [Gemmatimonadaceae bacterium]
MSRRTLAALTTAACALAAAGCAAGPRAALPDPPAADRFDLVVAATTDVHGHLRGWDYYAGAADPISSLARAATIVDSLRAAAPGRVVLLDAGDLLQGTPLTYVAARVDTASPHPVIAAMNAMAYDAAVIGNHEFNYGLATLSGAMAGARFPFLAANVYRPDGARAYAPWRIVTRGPVHVGIVGATTPGSAVWDRDKLEGKLEFRDIVPAVREAVAEVRARGADVVVVTLHSGLDEPSSYDTVATRLPSENVSARVAREVAGIDLLVYGHSHRQMADTTIGTTMLMQPKNWAQSVGVAHLALERDGGRWRVAARRGELVPTRGRAESERVLAATAEQHARTVAYVQAPIGSTPAAWRADSSRVEDTPIIDLILDVERRATGAELASTAAFSLDASLDSGAITIAELARLYPYENTLKAVRITGRQLREYLEFSARYFGTHGTGEPAVDPKVPGFNFDIVAGADYAIDLSRPVGSRITRLAVKGRPVADADSFTFALNNYRQSGGGGYAMLRGAPVVHDGTVEIRQLIIDEVRRRGTIRPSDVFERNWEIVPRAAIAPVMAAIAANPFERGRAPARAGAADGAAGGAKARRLRVVSTNDFHGALLPRADSRGTMRGGAAYVAAAIERARAECDSGCAFLLVDGGDMMQGSPASNLAFGRPVMALYGRLGYAAAALGNHEFDWGQDTLRARMRQARFRILGANVRYADGRDVEWIPDDTLVERGGLKVGIIGVASVVTASTTRAVNVRGLRFDDPAPIIDERARAMRARGADFVVVLAHDGAFCGANGRTSCGGEIVDIARRIREPVDLIVSGHTHSLIESVVNGIPIMQARSNGTAIGVADLVPGGEGAVEVRDILTDSLRPDPAVDSLVRGARDAVAARTEARIATLATAMPRRGDQYALGNLIADAQRWAGKADVAIMNNGGIRTGLPAGTVTWGQLFEVQPFGNTLHRMTVLGADLRAYLERELDGRAPDVHVSGVVIRVDPARPAGERITSLATAAGRAMDPARRYTLVMNDFMATGRNGAALAKRALTHETLDLADLDAFVNYLRAATQPVRAPSAPRIIVSK